MPSPRLRSLGQETLLPDRSSRALERCVLRLDLEEALARCLTPDEGAVIRHRLEGRTLAETGALLARSAESVRQLQSKALAKLRRLFE